MNNPRASRPRITGYLLSMSLVLALTPGCGPGDNQSKSTSISPQEQLVNALCDGLASCCATQKFAFDRSGCEGNAQLFISSRGPTSDKAVLDTAAVVDCANEIRQAIAQCDPSPTHGACDRIYVGTLATNASCSDSRECAPVNGAEVYCASVCYARKRGARGDTCQNTCRDSMCSFDGDVSTEHTVCNVEDNLACINGKCATAPTAGQACSNGLCAQGAQCNANLVCVAEASIAQDCANAPCVAGAYCENGACAAQLAAGGACTRNAACLSGSCSTFDANLNSLTCTGGGSPLAWDAAACAGDPSF